LFNQEPENLMTDVNKTYELIDVRTEAGKVGIITLNRPKQLNSQRAQAGDCRREWFCVGGWLRAGDDV
jgi:hypothetical protein